MPKIELRKKVPITLFNIFFLITELNQARTLKDRIIAALKVSILNLALEIEFVVFEVGVEPKDRGIKKNMTSTLF